LRDLPNIARIAVVGLLLASLLLILRQCGSGNGSGPVETDASGQKKEAAGAILPEAVFYPAVPGTLPDLNDGYLFNKDRFLDESDLADASPSGFGADTIDMEALVYSGSIIIGDLRKALVAYQEKAPVVQRGARRNVRTRNQRKPAKGAYIHKQLELGELFMGYRVARIEDDSIVFEKGSEKIEKFLFDASKERVEIKSSTPASPPASTVQPRAIKTVSPPPGRPASQPPQARPRPTTTKPGSSSETPANSPSRRVRRSQRLLGIDPSFVPPTLPEGTN
jgi:hypothetical protein